MTPQHNFAQAKRILLGVLGLNWLVSAAKIFVGYTINSVSMIADGFHSLLDGASNIIGLVGLTIASKERDEAGEALRMIANCSLKCWKQCRAMAKRYAPQSNATAKKGE